MSHRTYAEYDQAVTEANSKPQRIRIKLNGLYSLTVESVEYYMCGWAELTRKGSDGHPEVLDADLEELWVRVSEITIAPIDIKRYESSAPQSYSRIYDRFLADAVVQALAAPESHWEDV